MTVTDSAHDFRVGVIGAGMMGADHVKRIGSTISGARVSAVVDPDESRVASALENAPGAVGYSRIEDALEDQAIDGVLIATPGFLHEPVLLPCLEAKLPILCEKPLTPDPESSWRILEAEQATGEHLIQVGFMRRFDPEYRQLRELVDSEDAGELLMLRCAHRNPSVPDSYLQESLINDSVVHEFDVVPWLADSPIVTLEVKHARRNRLTPERLKEPILVLMELANGTLVDLEMNVSIQFGYQVTTEAVFDSGIARIGEPSGLQLWHQGRSGVAEHADFTTRFATAYDNQVQAWVDAACKGTIAGPSAWDGYKVAVACQEGVASLSDGRPRSLNLPETPAFYL
ncbi:Gfo/Idh/MocA family oxidoreductase [Brevibacterium sp. UCMA 11754]|uniref:Gfo/Idh/MocA family oxidoreductase n=1 Tax=Brevibacterium sp. UCMA 11754 TaxID=2749198 RepID=UPI001F344F72|nr:Gfo/Idh/MocA family oxidoreductase [Brevibacterium sp. UCMA 11754]MCF2571698.1 Gfo/Idh/MocA family oxidoreductase [Brevibacterium sp. UCMA 11754]